MKILLLALGLAAIVRTDSTSINLTEDPPEYPFELGTITWSEISSGGYKLAGTFKAVALNTNPLDNKLSVESIVTVPGPLLNDYVYATFF